MTNWKSFAFVSVAVFGLIFAFSPAEGALNAYMTIKGQKQGLIKGGVTQKGREGRIMVIESSHEIVTPRDPATGQATGKRSHKPFTVRIEWDQALPNLYRALFTNEILTEVTIDYFAPRMMGPVGGAGQEVNHMTVTMTNASIVSIQSQMPNSKMPELARLKEYAEISFTYQKIEYSHKMSGATVSDGVFALLLPKQPVTSRAEISGL